MCLQSSVLWARDCCSPFVPGVIQVRRFGKAMHSTLGKVFEKSAAKDGSISPFQAVCTALAGTVGTGNIAGVAGAVAIGGPGAVFWMWCSAFLGMCTKFSKVVLAIHFREKNAQGEYIGGPMYYIKNGLGKNGSGWARCMLPLAC